MSRAALPGFVLGLAVGMCVGEVACANPQGPQVVSGVAGFARPNAHTLNITNSPNAIINWQGFSIHTSEITRFIQSGAGSAVLNRVVGGDPSAILGQLLSNGRVFLINPNGIVFGPGSVVDTAGLVASTLNLSNQNFLAGKYEFEAGTNAGGIRNQGFIRAGPDGSVFLIAPDIENSGIVQVDNGALVLAAGRKVTITSLETGGIQFEVQAPEDEVLNLGELIAERGTVGAFAGTLTNSGVIEANSIGLDEQGNVVLGAIGDVHIEPGSRVGASGPQGGNIRIESETGTTWVTGRIEATGTEANGGTVEVLGERVGLIDRARIDVSGETGGGEVRIGGGYQGQGAVPTARQTFTGPETSIAADAITEGDGGEVIVWADESAQVHGAISARGGVEGGDGGLVETSGKERLDITTVPDIRAPAGDAGEWLIDPNDIYIVGGNGFANINDFNPFETLGDNAQLGVNLITAALSGGATVTVTTGNAGTNAEAGNISLDTPLDINATIGTNTLTLSAAENIFINAPIRDSAPGDQDLNLNLLSDSVDNSEAGTFILADVNLGPGDLTTNGDFVQIDNGATVTVDDGASWTNNASRLDIGVSSAGTVNVSNGGSLIATGGGGIAVGAGAGGTGTLNVTGGGLVDIASDNFNNLDIGRVVGSTGTVTVDGTGSKIVTRGTDNTVQVGRVGTGQLTVSAGGAVNTLQFEVGREGAGVAIITGVDSEVEVAPDNGIFSGDFFDEAGFMRIGREFGSSGRVEVLAGGRLEVREGLAGTVGETTYSPELDIARNIGSVGELIVDGLGSVVEIVQRNPSGTNPDLFAGPTLRVGIRGEGKATVRNRAQLLVDAIDGIEPLIFVSQGGGQGSDPFPGAPNVQSTLSIESGASLKLTGQDAFFSIGHNDDSDGLVTVTGAGSSLITQGSGGGIFVGRAGDGELVVADGALLSTRGDDNYLFVSRDANGSPGLGRVTVAGGGRIDTLSFQVGLDGVGIATVTGDGSEVLVSNDNGNFTGTFALEAGFAQAGRNAGSNGTIEVLAGGKLTIRDSGGDEFGPELQVARNRGSSGKVIVDGKDASGNPSLIEITQSTTGNTDPNPFDGPTLYTRRGEGQIEVRNAGEIRISGESASTLVGWGGDPGDDPDPSEVFFPGSSLDVLTGGQLTLSGDGARVAIGHRGSDGNGAVTVDGAGSTLSLSGAGSTLAVGEQGHGRLVITNDGAVQNGAGGTVCIGCIAGSDGEVQVTGAGSTLDAGNSLNVNLDEFLNPGGNGRLILSGDATVSGAIVTNAGRIEGAGTIDGSVVNRGSLSPGASAGRLVVSGDLTLTGSSHIEIELAGTGVGPPLQFDRIEAGGNVALGGTLAVEEIDGFQTTVNDSFDVITCAGGPGCMSGSIGVGASFGDVYAATEGPTALNLLVTATNNYFAWDGEAGTSLWTNPLNWVEPGGLNNNARLPGAFDDVLLDTFGASPDAPITLSGASVASVLNLQIPNFRAGADETELLLTGSGTSLAVNGVALIGGDLAINGGANLSTSVGVGINDTGVTVDGGSVAVNDGSWSDAWRVTVGDTGLGSVVVGPAGTFTTNEAVVGARPGANGSVTVNGGSWTNNGFAFTVGEQGMGEVTIEGGGTLDTNHALVGRASGSIGTVTIDGGSWNAGTSGMTIGERGDGGLELRNGASVTSTQDTIGGLPGSRGAVTVNNSSWTTNSLHVGSRSTGELMVEGGATVSVAEDVQVGFEQDSSGNVTSCPGAAANFSCVTVRDPGSVFNMNGLNVGFEGLGELRIENGGVVNDASAFSFASNAAGSSSVITVTGTGSEFNAQFLGVGNGNAQFGVPGAETASELNILDGGKVTLGQPYVPGSFNGGGLTLGVERNATGTLVIDGTGSQLLTIGEANSVVVGRRGKGIATIQGGGSLKTLFFDVGRGPGGGLADPNRLTVTGASTLVEVTTETGLFSGSDANDGGFLRAARNFGDIGVIEVLDNARVEINSHIDQTDPGLQIAREPGSVGTVTVDNATIDILQSTPADPANNRFGPFVQAGRSGDGTLIIRNNATVNLRGQQAFVQVSRGEAGGPVLEQSSLQILSGGTLSIDGRLPGNAGAPEPGDFAGMNIGQEANADGNVLVRGAGSTLTVTGFESNINVGRSGTGALTIDQGGGVFGSVFMSVGRDPGSFGSVVVDGGLDPVGSRSTLSLTGVDATDQGAFALVGRRGMGSVEVRDGGLLEINGETGTFPGLQTGGSLCCGAGGTGSLSVTGAGTEFRVIGDSGFLGAGIDGIGTLAIEDGATVTGVQFINLGNAPGSAGTLNIGGPTGGASFSVSGAGATIDVGIEGTGILNVNNNSSLIAAGGGGIAVGAGPGGSGTLNVTGGGLVDVASDNFNNVRVAGEAGSTGTVTVTGTNSKIVTRGTDNTVRVGIGGTGMMTVSEGGEVRTLDLRVGRLGTSDGTVTVTGSDSKIIISPDDGNFSGVFAQEAGFSRMGREAGSVGRLHVLDGGFVQLRGSTTEFGPQLDLARNKGSFGELLIDGVGSAVEITQGTTPAGNDPNIFPGPSMQAGRRGEGQTTISNGGELRLLGEEAFLRVSRDSVNPDNPDPDPGSIDQQSRIDVLNGGKLILNGVNALMAIGDAGPAASGLVVVNGAASEIQVLGGAELGQGRGLAVGDEGIGELRVEAGGLVTVESGNFNNLDIGRTATGSGTVTVIGSDGVNPSTLITAGTDNTIQVGRAGTGTLSVAGGAKVETLQLEAGRDGNGAITITGAGSTVTVSPDNGIFAPPFELDAGFVRAGRNPGSVGVLEVTDGARLEIRDNAAGGQTEGGLQIAREPGSVGTVTVDNATIDILQSTPADPGNDRFGPFVQAGRSGEGTLIIRNGATVNLRGQEAFVQVSRGEAGGPALEQSNLEILSGGTLSIDGRLPSNAGLPGLGDFAGMNIGQDANGDGSVLVRGAGSALTVTGFESNINVGRSGTGALTIDQGGGVFGSVFMSVGRDPGSFGSVVIDGSDDPVGTRATLSLTGVDADDQGAFALVGRQGTGSVDVLGGALLKIDGETTGTFPGLQTGGSVCCGAGGTGTLTIKGANTGETLFQSEMQILGDSDSGFLGAGIDGIGTINIEDGASVTGVQLIELGFVPGSSGTLNLGGPTGGASFSVSGAGAALDIGIEGTGTVNVSNGSTLTATSGGTITVGAGPLGTGTLNVEGTFQIIDGGALQGAGTITGDVNVASGGTVNPGALPTPSTGILTITGNLNLAPLSTLDLEIGGIEPGIDYDQIAVGGTANLDGTLNVTLIGGFSPNGETFSLLTAPSKTGSFANTSLPPGFSGDNTGSVVNDIVADIFFDNDANNLLWNVAANWSGNALPMLGDDIAIDLGGGFTITLDSGFQQINSLVSRESLTISGGTLEIVSSSTINDTLTLSGGTLTGTGSLDVDNLSWSGGEVAITSLDVAGVLDISGVNPKTLTSTLNNAGAGTWAGTGNIFANAGAVFNNEAGATFDIRDGAAFLNNSGGTASFNNAGMLSKSAGSGSTFGSAIVFDNSGTVESQSGTLFIGDYTQTAGSTAAAGGDIALALSNGETSTGTFSVGAGRTLTISSNGTHTLGGTSSLAGAGGVAFIGGTTNVDGAYGVTGPLSVGGEVNFSTAVSVSALSLSGALGGSGSLSTDTLSWSGGEVAITSLDVAGVLDISGANPKTLTSTLNNAGAGTWAGTGNIFANAGAVFNNEAGATFDIRDGAAFLSNSGGTASFNNAGTLSKSAGAGTSTIGNGSLVVTNTGTVSAQAGTLAFNGYTQTAGRTELAGGDITAPGGLAIEGGILRGSGIITAGAGVNGVNVTNGASVEPGNNSTGILAVDGDFRLDAASSMVFEIGTTTPGSGHDQLTVSGTADLNGTLALVQVFPFSSDSGFDVVSCGACIGNLTLNAPLGFSLASGASLIQLLHETLFTISFDNGFGNLEWNVPANWDVPGQPDRLPEETDIVLIDLGGGELVTLSGGTHVIDRLSSQESLSLTGGSLTITGAATVNGDLTLSSTALALGDSLTVNGTTSWDDGATIQGVGPDGMLVVPAGRALNLSGTLEHAVDNLRLVNFGTVTHAIAGADLSLTNGSVIDNEAGGRFGFGVDRNVSGDAGTAFNNNAGTIEKTASAGTSVIAVDFHNTDGTVDSQSGLVSVEGASNTFTGTLSVTGSPLRLAGSGTHTFSDGSLVSGDIELASGTMAVPGTTALNSTLGWVSGDARIDGLGPGTLVIPNGSNLDITGPLTHVLEAITLSNAGTVRYNVDAGAALSLDNGTVLLNQPAGLLDFQADRDIASAGGGAVQNLGTVRKSAGAGTGGFTSAALTNEAGALVDVDSGTLRVQGSLGNAGTIDVASGATFEVSGAAFSNDATGTVTLAANGTVQAPTSGLTNAGLIRGSGTVAGTVNSQGGRYAPGNTPGILTITGDWNLDQGSTVLIELAGSGGTAGTDFDRVAVGGSVTLDGTLSVELIDPFVPSDEAFDIVTCAGAPPCVSGFFESLVEPAGVATLYVSRLDSVARLVHSTADAVFFDNDLGNLLWQEPLNWSSNAVPVAGDNAVIDLTGVLTVTLSSGSQSVASVRSEESVSIENAAVLTIGAPGSVFNADLSLSNATLQGSGDATVAGAFTVSGGTLGLDLVSNATSEFAGGINTVAAGGGITGTGDVAFSGGETTFGASSTYAIDGATNLSGDATARFDNSASTGTLDISGGTLDGAGTVTVAGLASWTGGDLLGGALNVNGGLDLIGGGGTDTRTLSRRVNVAGTSAWSGDSVTISGNGLVTNTGTLNLTNTGSHSYGFEVSNAGTMSKSAAGNVEFGNSFVTSGELSVSAGALDFTGTFSQSTGLTQFTGGSISAINSMSFDGGVLGGTGTLDANVVVGATTVDPGDSPGSPGVLTITRDLTLGPASTVVVQLNGTTAGTGHDQLDVRGSAALGGTLQIEALADFVPDTSYDVITCGVGCSGAFSNLVEIPEVAGGFFVNNLGAIARLVHNSLASIFFDNDAGDFLWTTLSNWNTNTLPTENDEVLIDLGGGATPIEVGSGTQTVKSVVSEESLLISGGELALLLGDSAVNGDITISGGTLTIGPSATLATGTASLGGGTLAGGGSMSTNDLTWSGGTVAIAELDVNSSLAISGSATKTLLGTLNNLGTATWSDAGNISAGNGAVFGNSGTFNVQNDASYLTAGGTSTFNNSGLFRKTVGSGTSAIGAPGGNLVTFTNSGTVRAETGTLTFNDYSQAAGDTTASGGNVSVALANGATSDGTFDVGGGNTLSVSSNGTHTLGGASSVSGPGTVAFTGSGTTNVAGTYNVGGGTSVSGGTANFDTAASTTNLAVSGGTASFNAGATTTTTTVSGGSASFGGPSSATSLTVSGGTANFNAGATTTTTTVSGGSATFGGPSSTTSLAVSGGTASFNAPSSATNVALSSGTLGGTSTLATQDVGWSGGTVAIAELDVNTNLTISGTSPKTLSGTINSAVPVDLNAGTGAVTGGGTISGDVNVNGLRVEIAGPTAFDTIAVNGNAALGGQLQIVFVNGFNGSLGDTFDIMTYTTAKEPGTLVQTNFSSITAPAGFSFSANPDFALPNTRSYRLTITGVPAAPTPITTPVSPTTTQAVQQVSTGQVLVLSSTTQQTATSATRLPSSKEDEGASSPFPLAQEEAGEESTDEKESGAALPVSGETQEEPAAAAPVGLCS